MQWIGLKNGRTLKKLIIFCFTVKVFKVSSAQEGIVRAYNRKETDEFVSPTVIVNSETKPISLIKDND